MIDFILSRKLVALILAFLALFLELSDKNNDLEKRFLWVCGTMLMTSLILFSEFFGNISGNLIHGTWQKSPPVIIEVWGWAFLICIVVSKI
jgi:hypothetical protein